MPIMMNMNLITVHFWTYLDFQLIFSTLNLNIIFYEIDKMDSNEP